MRQRLALAPNTVRLISVEMVSVLLLHIPRSSMLANARTALTNSNRVHVIKMNSMSAIL